MNIGKIESFDSKIKNEKEEVYNKNLKIANKGLSKKDVVINFIKISITSILGFLLVNHFAFLLFENYINNGNDIRILLGMILIFLGMAFSSLPLASITTKDIKHTKEIYQKKDYNHELTGMFAIASMFLLLFAFFLIICIFFYYEGNDEPFHFFAKYSKVIYQNGIIATLSFFTITSLYHYFTTKEFSNNETEDGLINEIENHSKNVEDYKKELDNIIVNNFSNYKELEYLNMISSEGYRLDEVLSSIERVKDVIAKKKGFLNFEMMRKNEIKSNFEQHKIVNE